MPLDVRPLEPVEDEPDYGTTVLDSEPVTTPEEPGELLSPTGRGVEPVSAAERLTSVDVLRGFALL
jgi:hypothetical protein